MNNSRFIWGIIILALGGLFLASNFGFLSDGFWYQLWKFWPAILIIWGIAVLLSKKERNINKTGLIISIIIILAIIACAFWQADRFSSEQVKTTIIQESSDKPIINLNLKFGASELVLDGNGYQALSGQTRTFTDVVLNRQDVDDTSSISVDQSVKYPGHWIGKGSKNTFNLSLSPNPRYRISVDTGASKFNLDLSKVKLESLSINGGACTGDIRLSENTDQSRLNLSSGASSFNIFVPKGSSLSITDDSGFSSIDVSDLNLTRNGKEYKSENYDTAKQKIEVRLSTGASSIKFMKY